MTAPESTSPFAWERSPEGHWERNADECEDFYRCSKKKDAGCFPVTACGVLSVHPHCDGPVEEQQNVEAALRSGWATLRHHHPTLISRLRYEDISQKWKRVYVPFQKDDDEAEWLLTTFQVVETDGDAVAWFNGHPPSPEISTLYLLGGRAATEEREYTIVLRCPHDVTDGVGILHLLNQLLEHAASAYRAPGTTQRDWDDEPSRLSPCLRVAAGIPDTLSPAQARRHEEIQAKNGTVYSHPALLGLPPSAARTASDPSKIQRRSVSFDEDTTAKILSGCKTIGPGISITHVFRAALALVLAEVQPRKDEGYTARFISHSMINLRPVCRPPFNGPEHAAAPYHTISPQALGIDVVVSCASDENDRTNANELPKLAAQVREFFEMVRPTASSDMHEQVFLAPSTFRTFTAPEGVDPHAVSNPPFCPVSLTSVGNVASLVVDRYGELGVRSVWVASEPIGAGVALFMSTWAGELDLSAVYDARFHDGGYVEGFLTRIQNCVCRGLEVDFTN